MAILEEDVWVTLHSKTAGHYEELGYYIPRYINKEKKSVIKKGTKILVKIDDLKRRSNVKVTKVCDICGKHIQNQNYNWILEQRYENKDFCYNCGKAKGGKTKKIITDYKRSLEYMAKENDKKYLLQEYSEKNKKKPSEVFPSASDKCIWNCFKCHGEYISSLNNRWKGSNCPYCSNLKALKGYNDLWTTNPEIAKLLKDRNKGHEIVAGSIKKQIFICENCGFEQTKSLAKVIESGLHCKKCSDNISYPEKLLFNLLEQLETSFETQKSFEWSQNKRYDFYICSENCIIESHGLQHFKEGFSTMGGRLLKDEIKNDYIKQSLAMQNKIDKYVVLDCRNSNLNYIKNSILNSDLIRIFDLNNINWEKCHEYACSSLVKITCNIWNDGIKNANEIAKLMKLSRSCIIRYLKQGAELDWCDYDPKKEMIKNGYLNGEKSKKKIIQLSLGNEYIKEWESAEDAMKELKTLSQNIRAAARGVYKQSGGYKWMFKKDYELLNQNN